MLAAWSLFSQCGSCPKVCEVSWGGPMCPDCPSEKTSHWCFRAWYRTLKLVPCFKSIMQTNLNYILSEHVCSSKVTRISRFTSAMLRHTEIKVCSKFHLLYTCNLSPQIFDCFFSRKSARVFWNSHGSSNSFTV